MKKITVLHLRYPWFLDYAGMMLAHNGKKAILIDTALEDAAGATIEPALRQAGLGWNDLKWVVNTHSHFDHTGCNAAIKQRSAARFAVHEAGAEALRQCGTPPDLLLAEGTRIGDDELSLIAIHTPGHSADSVSFLEPETGTLFAGDAIEGRGTAGGGLALFQDPEAYCASIRKLLILHRNGAFTRLLFSHPFLPSDGEVPGGMIAPFLQGCLDTVAEYQTTLADALKTSPELSAENARELLLARCGASLFPGAADLSLGTARTMLNFSRSAPSR